MQLPHHANLGLGTRELQAASGMESISGCGARGVLILPISQVTNAIARTSKINIVLSCLPINALDKKRVNPADPTPSMPMILFTNGTSSALSDSFNRTDWAAARLTVVRTTVKIIISWVCIGLPRRVSESPLQFECKVREVIETSGKARSGNLIICEIVHIHMDESIFDNHGVIDPDKIDLVGRLGGDYYVRTSGNAKFMVPKPISQMGIGIDSLPEKIRLSKILTGNDLGQLGNLESLPTEEKIDFFKRKPAISQIKGNTEELHKYAHTLIEEGSIEDALTILMID